MFGSDLDRDCRVGKGARGQVRFRFNTFERVRRAHALRLRFAARSTRGHGAAPVCLESTENLERAHSTSKTRVNALTAHPTVIAWSIPDPGTCGVGIPGHSPGISDAEPRFCPNLHSAAAEPT